MSEILFFLPEPFGMFGNLRSHILRKSKNDCYKAVHKRGDPLVPSDGLSAFPVIVQNDQSRPGQSAKMICFTAGKCGAPIEEIDCQLQPSRVRSSQKRANGQERVFKLRRERPLPIHNVPDDVVVREFVPGVHYSVVMTEFGTKPNARQLLSARPPITTPLALSPIIQTAFSRLTSTFI
ncbi:hypothetical protein FQN49_004699 [Arthroderma sp. PD_2]|nr:hypothetical protein FQN49_004699 [Arthroderma sp. PD_2]